ncbi:MAG: hypothetical protein DRI44_00980 [Chlamydiae bacterium]|nr:MAG: hypothetical protein DRI44_00980 [Chlamydiota bacterium]
MENNSTGNFLMEKNKKNFLKSFLLNTIFVMATAVAVKAEDQNRPFEIYAQIKPNNRIDEIVLQSLRKYHIKPANLSSDAVFLRRVYVDVIGTLPTEKEVRKFLADKSPYKRKKIINQLFKRKEFADYWALKWGDLLRIKSEFPINLWPNGVQAYYTWIHSVLEKNMPYNKFAYELLTSSGSNFRQPQVNFYKAVQEKTPKGLAEAVALTFMGIRLNKLPKEQQEAMMTFFSRVAYKKTEEWKEEIIYLNPAPTNILKATLPDGKKVTIQPNQDPRIIFAEWLVNPGNPCLTRNIVNRIWFWLMGRGIINPPDDITSKNKPVNPKLLSFLEKELIKSNYNLRHIYKIILNSRTYQQSSIPQSENPRTESLFAYYPVRRLDAEVLSDAVSSITGIRENYISMVPEPFTFIPNRSSAISLADGSISSSFLEMFGKPSRDTGYESERNNKITTAQRLHFLNSTHIQNKIKKSQKLRQIIRNSQRRKGNENKIIQELYLNILSRYPTEEEIKTVDKYFMSEKESKKNAIMDVVWALFNTKEFLCKH